MVVVVAINPLFPIVSERQVDHMGSGTTLAKPNRMVFNTINLYHNKQCGDGSGLPLHNVMLFLIKMAKGAQ